ncbi:MAG: hypothetical protein HQL46_06200 [Gammaproteobacteria bacterium]|nr:hypothetical protein [Gammaproteobacteria bacterium]
MALAQDDIKQIQELIKQELQLEPVNNANVRYEIELRERMLRVEEELKHQRELMLEGFKQSDIRFKEMQHNMDKRFEQVEKRFEQVDKRFEQVDKRFEQVDKRFESMQETMNNGFKEINRRMDRFMFWSLGVTISTAIFVVTYLK